MNKLYLISVFVCMALSLTSAANIQRMSREEAELVPIVQEIIKEELVSELKKAEVPEAMEAEPIKKEEELVQIVPASRTIDMPIVEEQKPVEIVEAVQVVDVAPVEALRTMDEVKVEEPIAMPVIEKEEIKPVDVLRTEEVLKVDEPIMLIPAADPASRNVEKAVEMIAEEIIQPVEALKTVEKELEVEVPKVEIAAIELIPEPVESLRAVEPEVKIEEVLVVKEVIPEQKSAEPMMEILAMEPLLEKKEELKEEIKDELKTIEPELKVVEKIPETVLVQEAAIPLVIESAPAVKAAIVEEPEKIETPLEVEVEKKLSETPAVRGVDGKQEEAAAVTTARPGIIAQAIQTGVDFIANSPIGPLIRITTTLKPTDEKIEEEAVTTARPNIIQAFQNALSNVFPAANAPASAEGDATTAAPNFFQQGLTNIQNFVRPPPSANAAGGETATNPFSGAIMAVQNFIRPTAAPTKADGSVKPEEIEKPVTTPKLVEEITKKEETDAAFNLVKVEKAAK